jgi:uncharacterized damage-inducible protein DinB
MKEILINQIAFENWANEKLLATLKTVNNLPERAILLFSHLMSANQMWLSRFNSKPINTTLFQERTLQESENLFAENKAEWVNLFSNFQEKEFSKEIEFTFPIDGSKRKISIADAIFHIVHHSSYHRGQIVTLLKGLVEPLPMLNYIIYSSKLIEADDKS